MEKEQKIFTEYLKKVSPGTSFRVVLDDLMRSNRGAIIAVHAPGMESILEGGFKINAKFTSQRLFELCKMDGAVILSPDMKKILYANVVLNPGTGINTSETGTRHRAGEKTAKQLNTFVIVVSERKNKTTLYHSDTKQFLRDTTDLLNEANNNLILLEKQREIYDELLIHLNILEISNIVTVGDVCKIVQRAEIILKISEAIKRYFTELGNLGSIINVRYKELLRGVEKTEENILRDYAELQLKKAKQFLSGLNFDNLMELEFIGESIMNKQLEESINTRGYRFLSNLELNEKEISQLINYFGTLDSLLQSGDDDLKLLFKGNHEELKIEIAQLKDQMISGNLKS